MVESSRFGVVVAAAPDVTFDALLDAVDHWWPGSDQRRAAGTRLGVHDGRLLIRDATGAAFAIGTVTVPEERRRVRFELDGGAVEVGLVPQRSMGAETTRLELLVTPPPGDDLRWASGTWGSMPYRVQEAAMAGPPSGDAAGWVVSQPLPGQPPPEPYDPYFEVPRWDVDQAPDRSEWAPLADFGWAQSLPGDLEMTCVAAVRDRSPDDVLRVLSREAVTEPMPAAQAREWAAEQSFERYGTALEAGRLGDWTVVVEIGGYQATDTGQVEALSADGGAAVAVVWSPDGGTYLIGARDGRRVRFVDADVDWSETPYRGRRLVQEEGLTDGDEPGRQRALALLQRLTGVRFDLATILEPGDRVALGVHPG